MNLFKKRKKRKLTVETYMTEWLETTKKPTLKPSSYDRIEATLRFQIFNNIGDIPIQELSSENIQKMLNGIADNKSFSTVKKAYQSLNSCFNFAVLKGTLKRSPMLSVVLPAQKNRIDDVSYYTKEQINLIVDECTQLYKNGKSKYRYGYVILLMLNTGLRLGEVLYLKWKDVNFEKKFIYVHGDVSCVKSRNGSTTAYTLIEQDTPKTKKSTRYVTLNENAINSLLKLKSTINDSTRVIATQNSTIVNPRKIYDTMSRILKACDITDAKDIVHALRHTFATLLIQQGIDIKVVSELLGHSDVSTTIRIYYHVIEEQKHSAVQKLDNFY